MAIVAHLQLEFEQFKKAAEEAADSLHEIEKASDDVAEGFKSMQSAAKLFGVALTATAVVNYVKSLGNQAEALENLSRQTSIGVEDLQRLRAATQDFGVDSTELGNALYQLSKRIAGGGGGDVTSGLAMMGLALRDVENLKGEELFLKILRAAGQLETGMRNVALASVFGDKLAASLGALSTGVDQVEKKMADAVIATTDENAALAEANRQANQAIDEFGALATRGLAPVARGFVAINESLKRDGGWMALLTAGLGNNRPLIENMLDEMRRKTEAVTTAAKEHETAEDGVTSALKRQADQARFMATIEAQATEQLSAAQKATLERLRELGALNATNAKQAADVNAAQLAAYNEQVEAAKKAATELAAAQKKAAAELAEAQKEADRVALVQFEHQIRNLETLTTARARAYGTGAQIAQLRQLQDAEEALTRTVYKTIESEKERMKLIEDNTSRQLAIGAQINELQEKRAAELGKHIQTEIQAQAELNRMHNVDLEGYQLVSSAAETYRLKLKELTDIKETGGAVTVKIQLLEEAYAKTLRDEAIAADDAAVALRNKARAAEEAAKQEADAARAAAAAQTYGVPANTDFSAQRRREIMQAWEEGRYHGPVVNGGPGNPAGTGPDFRAIGFAARARGGPVSAGQSYMVGEEGPELYTPRSSGTITPSGGVTVYNTFHVVDTEANIVRRVSDAIARSVARGQKLGPL